MCVKAELIVYEAGVNECLHMYGFAHEVWRAEPEKKPQHYRRSTINPPQT